MKNYKYTKTETSKFAIKGTISDDGTYMNYKNEDKDACTIEIADIIDRFKGAEVVLTVSMKADYDLDEEE